MEVRITNPREPSRINARHFGAVFPIFVLLLCFSLSQPVSSQQVDTASLAQFAPLSTEEVVQNLVRMNLERAQALRAFQGTRIYRARYHGRSAEMAVEVRYESPGTKEFVIQSATGSKLIIDKVFRKLLQSEKEALDAEIQRRTALNNDNYDFTLIGYEGASSGSMYVLAVEPKTKGKFLYRGRVWVDAKDFAVVRLKAVPAKNPSFWTKNTEVEQVYMKVSDFWLPAHNRSVTSIRLGGHAELIIEYNDYRITGADPVGGLTSPRSTRSAEADRAQPLDDHR